MKYFNFFLIIIFFLFKISYSEITNEIFTYQKTENIDGTEFTYSKKIINGKKEFGWFINNQEVDKQEYKEHFFTKKQKEWEKEFENEEENEFYEQELKVEMQIGVIKKLLTLKIRDIEESLKKIKELKDYNLNVYFAFADNTFKSNFDIDHIERSLIPEIKRYLEKSYDKITLFDLNNYLEKIQDYPEKLNSFFKNTINNAIKLCDDTKLLRKLLELIN